MQRKKPTAPEARPSERKPTAAKSSTKSKTPLQPTSLPASQSKLEKGKANLKKLLRKIEEGDNPYAERNFYRAGQNQQEQLKEEYTTNNVSSAYTTSLQNINTKEQTFATNEQNRQECELKSIWAEQFEEIAARKTKDKKFKLAGQAQRERLRQRHNKSCSDRFTSRKNLEVVRSAFNSLDSCKSSKSPKAKPTLAKPKKKMKKPLTTKKTKQDSVKTSLTPSSLNTPRSLRSQTEAFKSGGPTTLLQLRSPKKNLEVPYADFFGELVLPNNRLPSQQRKITEVSDEELECSIVKSKTLKNNSFKKNNRLNPSQVPFKKGKAEALRCLREQIRNKVEGLYPTLKLSEKKLVCAVILIQRLWRQSKVKNIIGQFLTPKKAGSTPFVTNKKPVLPESIPERSVEKSGSSSKKTPQKLSQPPFLFLTPPTKKVDSPRQPPPFHSRSETVSAASSQSSLPSSKHQASILKFVDSYRTMVLDSKRANKPKEAVKPNFFSLTTSLSDKCLLGGMYRKIFSFGEDANHNISGESKLHSKLMIRKNAVAPPEKLDEVLPEPEPQLAQICTVLSSERFYTEVKQEELIVPKKQQPVLEIIEPEDKADSREVISNNLAEQLLDQFIEEFFQISKKLQSQQKRKKKLPCLKTTKASINLYLDGLIEFLLENYQQSMIRNLNKTYGVNPLVMLRFQRQDLSDDEASEEAVEDQYCNEPVFCKEVYFEYQAKFEKERFKISAEEENYVNFLELLLKINNKLLLDCFTEVVDSMRVYGLRGKPEPWEWTFTRTAQKITKENLPEKLQQARNVVREFSSYKLGSLDKRLPHREYIDEQNLLQSLREDYSRTFYDWQCHPVEMLEVQMHLSNQLFDWLLQEALEELAFS